MSAIAFIVGFLVLNSALSIGNRWALGVSGFTFPLLLTTCHMAFGFLALSPLMLCEPFRSQHPACIKQSWKGILIIGACQAFNVALNNLSLVLITLSLNQIIRYWHIQYCWLFVGVMTS